MPSSTPHLRHAHEASPELATAVRAGPLRGLVRRTPLGSFLVLACLLSWWPAGLHAVGVSGPPVAGFGPFLAAVTVLGLTEGRGGVGRLLHAMVQWRAPARSYLAALGLPMLVSGAAIAVTLAAGAGRPDAADLASWTNVPAVLVLVLLVPGIGGAWEEPGFRGFALRRFEDRYGMAAGALLLGLFWVFWHAPLFWTGDILWPDVAAIVAAAVVLAALFHAARGSVLVVMLFHATNNAVAGEFASGLFHGSERTTLAAVTAVGWWLVAGGILVRTRHHLGRRQAAYPAGER